MMLLSLIQHINLSSAYLIHAYMHRIKVEFTVCSVRMISVSAYKAVSKNCWSVIYNYPTQNM